MHRANLRGDEENGNKIGEKKVGWWIENARNKRTSGVKTDEAMYNNANVRCKSSAFDSYNKIALPLRDRGRE